MFIIVERRLSAGLWSRFDAIAIDRLVYSRRSCSSVISL